MRSVGRIGRPGKAMLLVAVGAVGGGAALAVASVPDGVGVIHACVQVQPGSTLPATTSGNIRVIDSPGQTCRTADPAGGPPGELPLDWSVTGPPGAPGAIGPTKTIVGGQTLILPGGKVVTVGGGGGGGGSSGSGITLAAPTVNDRGSGIGRVSITGNASLGFDVFAVSLVPRSTRATGGSGAGKVSVHDISIAKKVDKASPALSAACATGKHFSKVTISLRKTRLSYELTDVLVSSVQFGGAGGGGDVPLEHITLNFAKLAFKTSK